MKLFSRYDDYKHVTHGVEFELSLPLVTTATKTLPTVKEHQSEVDAFNAKIQNAGLVCQQDHLITPATNQK